MRETGGTGSDIQVLLDGFSGRHVKVFVDGVPQEGVGSSFGLNNIPVNFAERIEIYKGVVPVGFGTDAIGGVINVVTNKSRKPFWLDASYSYGSFNTHGTSVGKRWRRCRNTSPGNGASYWHLGRCGNPDTLFCSSLHRRHPSTDRLLSVVETQA